MAPAPLPLVFECNLIFIVFFFFEDFFFDSKHGILAKKLLLLRPPGVTVGFHGAVAPHTLSAGTRPEESHLTTRRATLWNRCNEAVVPKTTPDAWRTIFARVRGWGVGEMATHAVRTRRKKQNIHTHTHQNLCDSRVPFARVF